MNKIQADKVICHWAAARLRKWAKEQNAKADDASRQAHSGQGDWYSEVRLEYAKKCRELAMPCQGRQAGKGGRMMNGKWTKSWILQEKQNETWYYVRSLDANAKKQAIFARVESERITGREHRLVERRERVVGE